MPRIYVRTNGNDSTGTGSITLPFLTIRRASLAWTTADVIDVGEGTFKEVLEVSTIDRMVIEGSGFDKTTVQVDTPTLRWIRVNTGTITYLCIAGLTIQNRANDTTIIKIDNCDAAFTGWIAKCLVQLNDGYVVTYQGSTTTPRFDILNCVVTSVSGYGGTVFFSTKADVLGARNTIFTKLGLVTDDSQSGLAADINYCVFWDNVRHLDIGAYGDQSIVDKDPQFVPDTVFVPNLDSKLVNGGVDLSAGYGNPLRQPPIEVNWNFIGLAPDIGLHEINFVSSTSSITVKNLQVILQAFGQELDLVDGLVTQASTNHSMEGAESAELQRKWGSGGLLSAFRLSTWDDDTYRAFLLEVAALSATKAVTTAALVRLIELIYAVQPIVKNYFFDRRFTVGTDLRLSAVHAAPSDNTLTLRLSAGVLQLDRRWYRVLQTDLTLPPNSTSLVYVDGTLTGNLTLQPLQTVNMDYLKGYRPVTKTGSFRFRNGSTKVMGVGTLFTSDLDRYLAIRPLGSLHWVHIDSIQSNNELTLLFPYAGDDFTGSGELAQLLVPLGRATTNAVTITRLETPGLVGVTTFMEDAGGAGNGYDVIMNLPESILGDTQELRLLLTLLSAFKPMHRRGYLSFLAEYPVSKPIELLSVLAQSNVDYLEAVDDGSWPTS